MAVVVAAVTGHGFVVHMDVSTRRTSETQLESTTPLPGASAQPPSQMLNAHPKVIQQTLASPTSG